jgi:hypothetical protein
MQNWSSYPLKSFFIYFDYRLFYLFIGFEKSHVHRGEH